MDFCGEGEGQLFPQLGRPAASPTFANRRRNSRREGVTAEGDLRGQVQGTLTGTTRWGRPCLCQDARLSPWQEDAGHPWLTSGS